MILVTGASGKTGKTIIRQLARRGAEVRAWVHHADQKADLKSIGATEVIWGDVREQKQVFQAVENIDTLYHICPNMTADEFEIGQSILTAARSVGVRRFVYHSVFHPQIQQMSHHWNKLRVEALIFASGLDFTILQPTAYMQNIQAYWPKILSEGRYTLPYSPETRLSLVDLEDVAEVVAKVIIEPGFSGGVYELVGTPPHSQFEIAAMISAQIGQTVQVAAFSRADWEKSARQNGMDEYAISTLLKMFEYYEAYGMGGNSGVLEWILGRPPRTFSQFVNRMMQEPKI
jgi:uncharacterized protein YbjT (DUF2867 family)